MELKINHEVCFCPFCNHILKLGEVLNYPYPVKVRCVCDAVIEVQSPTSIRVQTDQKEVELDVESGEFRDELGHKIYVNLGKEPRKVCYGGYVNSKQHEYVTSYMGEDIYWSNSSLEFINEVDESDIFEDPRIKAQSYLRKNQRNLPWMNKSRKGKKKR